jgi:hypothetical protein
MTFARVTVRNAANESRTAFLTTAYRYESPANMGNGIADNRYRRPVLSTKPGAYYQAGVEFNPDWTYGFAEGAFLRDGRVAYLFPTQPAPQLSLTLRQSYNNPPDVKTRKLDVQKTTPVGIVQYRLPLQPNQEVTLDFKMPYEPQVPGAVVDQLRGADFQNYRERTARFWDDLLAKGIEITLPEAKVNDTFRANLIYDLIARDKVGDDYVQTVNKFHYHAFWLRDSSYIVHAYDICGYHDIARQVLDFFARWQQPDGNFVSQGGQFDGWGQTLWAYGQHYQITADRGFAEKVYPSIVKAVAWLKQARANDPLHLMPATTPGDNENITGHVTGHNFWALAGLKNAIAMAQALGHASDAQDWRREYEDFRNALLAALNNITAQTNGYMPPGLDKVGGQDWGNMLAVYPEIILDPFDPKVTATLNVTRGKYAEGIMTYGDGRWLHHYLTMKNTETELVRGDQQMAIEELYALLVHTSSTHAGFEFAILPWATRDFDSNLAPHGWFAAKYIAVVRDMLLREQADRLHLLSALSPEWVKPGQKISVHRAATDFGQVNFDVNFTSDTDATMTFDNHFRTAPLAMVLHLPWFVNVQSVTVDGKVFRLLQGTVHLPSNARSVHIRWTRQANTPALNYVNAVNQYKTEYRRRYEEFLKTGQNH